MINSIWSSHLVSVNKLWHYIGIDTHSILSHVALNFALLDTKSNLYEGSSRLLCEPDLVTLGSVVFVRKKHNIIFT